MRKFVLSTTTIPFRGPVKSNVALSGWLKTRKGDDPARGDDSSISGPPFWSLAAGLLVPSGSAE